MKSPRAIWQAYADTGALSVPCANCGTGPGQWCTRPDGRVRRVPCVDRSAASISSGDGKPYAAHDFSQPIHPSERTEV